MAKTPNPTVPAWTPDTKCPRCGWSFGIESNYRAHVTRCGQDSTVSPWFKPIEGYSDWDA